LRDRIDKTPIAREQIALFKVLNVEFFPRESHLITFRDPWSFFTLYHPACNNLVKQHLEDVAQKVRYMVVCPGSSSDFNRLLACVWLLVNIPQSATTDLEQRHTKQAYCVRIWQDLCKTSLTYTRSTTKTSLLRHPGLGVRFSSQIEQWICSLHCFTSSRIRLWPMIFCQSKMATRSYTEQLSILNQVHRRKTWRSRRQTKSGLKIGIAT
jgi:hypothetical protein